jgi:hypothetical protein
VGKGSRGLQRSLTPHMDCCPTALHAGGGKVQCSSLSSSQPPLATTACGRREGTVRGVRSRSALEKYH